MSEETNVFRKEYRELTEAEKQTVGAVKDIAGQLHNVLADCAQSREMSLAKTKLEESVMWAVKALTA
jgi:hypothetical protein